MFGGTFLMDNGVYSADNPTAAELVSDSDGSLFENVLNNKIHVLRQLLPERLTRDYCSRPRSHGRSKTFMLFEDIY